MSDCCLQCQCDLCLNGHVSPLVGSAAPAPKMPDVRSLKRGKPDAKRAAELRREARAIQVLGQQYKRRAEQRAARFYDAAHRIDGLGRLRETRGGVLRREPFGPEGWTA